MLRVAGVIVALCLVLEISTAGPVSKVRVRRGYNNGNYGGYDNSGGYGNSDERDASVSGEGCQSDDDNNRSSYSGSREQSYMRDRNTRQSTDRHRGSTRAVAKAFATAAATTFNKNVVL